jgi:hypothetical protein
LTKKNNFQVAGAPDFKDLKLLLLKKLTNLHSHGGSIPDAVKKYNGVRRSKMRERVRTQATTTEQLAA